MIEQLKIIRDAAWVLREHNRLHFGSDHNTIAAADKISAALTQLEAMVGEPVQLDHIACIDGGKLRYMTGRKAPAYDCELYAMPDGKRAPNLYAAPVAQQPLPITPVELAKRIERGEKWEVAQQPQAEPFGYVSQHTNGTWEFSPTTAGVYPDTAKSITAVYAKQPQAEPDTYCSTTPDGGCISTDPRCMHQPQAEAVQYTRVDLDRAYSAGLVEGERMAIQQASPPKVEVWRSLAKAAWSATIAQQKD